MRDYDRWAQNEDGSWSRATRNASTGEVNGEEGVKATTGAMEAAEEAGLDIATIEGTGRDGQVTKADVDAAVAAAA